MTTLAPPISRAVTLIAAPEGYGKQIAVEEHLRYMQRPALHFYPREDQESLVDLVNGLAIALAPAAPGLASSFAGAVEYARQSAQPHDEFALWFGRHLNGVTATIVLHDLDVVRDFAFFKLITTLIEQSQATLQWLCVANHRPPLPWQAWESFGLLATELGESDLRLGTEEAFAYASACGCSRETASDLLALTAGWPLGFKLGARAAGLTDISEFAAPRREDLYEAFASILFESIELPLQNLLLELSLVAEFDEVLVRAMGAGQQWEKLAALAAEGLLLVNRPGGIVKFRSGFRSYLDRRLRGGGNDAVACARARVGAASEYSGRLIAAFRLYSGWNMSADVVRLCEAHGFELIENGHGWVLDRGLETIDVAELQTHPTALAVRAMEESRVGRHDTAEAWFLQALECAGPGSVKARIAYYYVLDLIRNGRVDGTGVLEECVDDPDIPMDLRASIFAALAIGHVLGQRFDQARAAVSAALTVAENCGEPSAPAKVLHHAAWVALFTGDIDRARTLAVRAVDTALSCAMYESAARAYTILYNIAYDVEDDPAASAHLLERILDCGMQAGSAPLRLFALLGMFDLATESGDAKALRRIERSLLSYEVNFGDPMTSAALVSGQAMYLSGRGRFSEAYDLLSPTAERQATADRRALRYSEMALYAAAAYRTADAQEAFARSGTLLSGLEAGSRRTVRTIAHLVLAGTLLGRKQDAKALLRDLTKDLEKASPRTRAFVEAIRAVLTRWAGTPNRTLLGARLQSMDAHELGGFAAVLSSLPLDPILRAATPAGTSAPQRIADELAAAREDIIYAALDEALPNARRTLQADLIVNGTIEQLAVWAKSGDDLDVVAWAESVLETRHSADLVAHLFGETVNIAARRLSASGSLDEHMQAALTRLRETLDAHVSAFQVRRAVETVQPVDPVDAKIEELLHRLCCRDEITYEHSRSVGAWCARLGRRMRLQRQDAILVMRSGLVHDIGKVLTPSEILQAPRRLDEAEWRIMKRHTLDGVRLMEPVIELRTLIPAVRWHHERYDGRGYPDALPQQDIPFAARMVAVADAFNAMIARRPYRDPLSPMAAIAQLREGSGTQFDPAVVENMIDVVLRPDR